MRKLLIPIAYLPSCQQALEFGAHLSLASGAGLTVLHVAPSIKDAPLGHALAREKLVEWGIEPAPFKLLHQAEEKLEQLELFGWDTPERPIVKHALKMLHQGLYERHLIGAGNQDVRFRVVAGQPAREILREAEDPQYDLIITGTRGHRGLQRFFRGSVAQEVALRAPCSILVAKGLRLDQAIMVGATGRPTSLEAVRQAGELAQQLKTAITVLAIARSPEEEIEAERHAEAGVALLAEMGLSAKGIVRRGDPAQVMIAEAGQSHILVLGRLERSSVKRYILGDISLRVLAQSHGSILIAVKPRPLPVPTEANLENAQAH
jgi:nucleotide-binding universal stress UspA family protein